MRLFKIHVKHWAPKDSHQALQGFLLRETEGEVCDYVMTKLCYWDKDDLEEEVEHYDEEYNYVGMTTKRANLLRTHGELFDEDAEVSNLHYGATHYGWEDLGEPEKFVVSTLEWLGLFLDKSEEKE